MKQKLSILLFLFILLLLVGACTSNKKKQVISRLEFERGSLIGVNAFKQNEIMELDSFICEISYSIDSIAFQESVWLSKTDAEGKPLSKDVIISNLDFFKEMLDRQRLRISELEDSIRAKNNNVAHLISIINFLNSQLDAKESELERTKKELEEKDRIIRTYKNTVTKLEKDVAELNEIKQSQDEMIEQVERSVNLCQVCVMSKNDLKKGGFLITSLFKNRGDLDYSKIDNLTFQKIDQRDFVEFTIEAKKVKVMTAMPEDSYSIKNNGNGSVTIRILDIERFWSISKKLVIQFE